jgi:hypothetical protein
VNTTSAALILSLLQFYTKQTPNTCSYNSFKDAPLSVDTDSADSSDWTTVNNEFDRINIKQSLCYAIKTYGGVNVQFHVFLISALVGDEWSDSGTGNFTPGGRHPDTLWIGDWVGPRTGLDDWRRENS